MVSQCTKFKVSRFTRYNAMNGGAKYRKLRSLRHLGVTQGHGQCHHSIERLYVDVLYRFRDIAGYLSKVDDFDPPHLHFGASVVGDPGRISRRSLA